MKFSIEIVDHIFSFLIPNHRQTLIGCSKDPVLSPIVDRLLYRHVKIRFGTFIDSNAFEPGHFIKLLSENPHIGCHVRGLHIQVDAQGLIPDSFANTLELFPLLEFIRLTHNDDWAWPGPFDTAIERCLSLPTMKELYLETYNSNMAAPISFLNYPKNIKYLTLDGVSNLDCRNGPVSTLPQLHSLRLLTDYISPTLLDWVKRHTSELQSLKFELEDWESVSEILGSCSASGTLKKWDVSILYTSCMVQFSLLSVYTATLKTDHTVRTGEGKPLPELTPTPTNLEQLTIRTGVLMDSRLPSQFPSSWLPATAKIITLLISSLRHLILDIDLFMCPDFAKVDFSPLAILGVASRSIPRIDLYIHSDMLLASGPAPAEFLSLLGNDEDVERAIKDGVMVIHSGKTAPDEY